MSHYFVERQSPLVPPLPIFALVRVKRRGTTKDHSLPSNHKVKTAAWPGRESSRSHAWYGMAVLSSLTCLGLDFQSLHRR